MIRKQRKGANGFCYVCGSACKADDSSFRIPGVLSFCSVNCLVSQIESNTPLPHRLEKLLVANEPYACGIGDNVCLSHVLGTTFKSFFEVVVAEVLAASRVKRCCYEPFYISLKCGSRDRIYVPDFYFPDHGTFVEVKGEWRNGGKRKFAAALSIFGPERLLLVSPYMRGMFVSERKGLSFDRDPKTLY